MISLFYAGAKNKDFIEQKRTEWEYHSFNDLKVAGQQWLMQTVFFFSHYVMESCLGVTGRQAFQWRS